MVGVLGMVCPDAEDPVAAAVMALNLERAQEDWGRNPKAPVPEEPGLEGDLEVRFDAWKDYFDTQTGEGLGRQESQDAMREELKYMESVPIWKRLSRLEPGDRQVPCKWVFKAGPPVRARLVACEVKQFAPQASEFAATPLWRPFEC